MKNFQVLDRNIKNFLDGPSPHTPVIIAIGKKRRLSFLIDGKNSKQIFIGKLKSYYYSSYLT